MLLGFYVSGRFNPQHHAAMCSTRVRDEAKQHHSEPRCFNRHIRLSFLASAAGATTVCAVSSRWATVLKWVAMRTCQESSSKMFGSSGSMPIPGHPTVLSYVLPRSIRIQASVTFKHLMELLRRLTFRSLHPRHVCDTIGDALQRSIPRNCSGLCAWQCQQELWAILSHSALVWAHLGWSSRYSQA